MDVGPEVTGETNPGPEGSPTRRTRVSGCCSDNRFSLRLGDAPCFDCITTLEVGCLTL